MLAAPVTHTEKVNTMAERGNAVVDNQVLDVRSAHFNEFLRDTAGCRGSADL